MALSNEQYDSIMDIYEKRQGSRRDEIERRKKILYEKIPEAAKIEGEIRSKVIAEVGRRLRREGKNSDGSDKTSGKDCLDEIQQLMSEKEEKMKKAGFEEDFLDPPYTCPDCKDTGFIGSVRCHCYEQLALEMFHDSRSDLLYGSLLSDFSLEYYSPEFIDKESGKSSLELAKSAKRKAALFVEGFEDSFANLLLMGQPGTGKTHLSGCIGGEILKIGRTVCYLTAFELFSLMKREAFSRGEFPVEEYSRIFSCDCLIIDDLGTEFATRMTDSQLFELVNERIRRKSSTIISTNLGLKELGESYTERLVSRFVEYYTPLKLAGFDIRMLKKCSYSVEMSSD